MEYFATYELFGFDELDGGYTHQTWVYNDHSGDILLDIQPTMV